MKRKFDLIMDIYKGKHLVESVSSTPGNADTIAHGYDMAEAARKELMVKHGLDAIQTVNLWWSMEGYTK